jgi:hypothetical protein
MQKLLNKKRRQLQGQADSDDSFWVLSFCNVLTAR